MEMNLTAEQLEKMKQQIEKLDNKLSELDKADYDSYQKRVLIKNEIKELTLKLLSATTLKVSDNDFIGLGSKFNATINFNGSIDTDNYLISDSDIKVPGFIVITTKTPIVKAVMGLKENDKFNYQVDGIPSAGIINAIYKCDVIESPKTMKKNK